MKGRYLGHKPNPFSSAELGGLDLPADEIAADGRLVRDLEGLADRGTVRPSPDFADRVMAAIAGEPTPAPMVAAGSAVRRLSLVGLLAAVRDAARVSIGRGFPAAVRAQAFSLLLAAGLAVGAGAFGTAGALGLLNGPAPSPAPSIVPVATGTPEPSQSGEPSQSAEPSTTEGPTDSSMAPEATGTPDASETPEPSESPDPADTPDGQNGTSSGGSTVTAPPSTPRPTPRPTGTPYPTSSPSPTHHEDGGGEHSPTPEPSWMPSFPSSSEPH